MVLGQSGYSLTCGVAVHGTENYSITYQWTKSNGTQTQVGTNRVLSFSPLRLSDAGQYTCQATITSPCSITEMDTHDITLQSELNYNNIHMGIIISYLKECYGNNSEGLLSVVTQYYWN